MQGGADRTTHHGAAGCASFCSSPSHMHARVRPRHPACLHDNLKHIVCHQRRLVAVLGVDVGLHQLHAAAGHGQAAEGGIGRGVAHRARNTLPAASPALPQVCAMQQSPAKLPHFGSSAAPARARPPARRPRSHVSLKDLSVFLCRLDTAMRAASCAGEAAAWGQSSQGRPCAARAARRHAAARLPALTSA